MTTDRKPSNRWRVYGSSPAMVNCRSERAAYDRVAALAKLGSRATVYHWEDGGWVLYERIESQEPSTEGKG
jgi:hypothetical protein